MDINRIKEIAEECKEVRPYPSNLFPPSLYYRFLFLLCKEKNPHLAVELGVCGGGGSLHMAKSGCRVDGIDIVNDYPGNIKHIEERFPNFSLCLGDSTELAEWYENESVGVLFIDTDHTYERTVKEFDAWLPKMEKGGIVCFDDLFRPGMLEAWERVEEPKIRLDHLHDGEYPHGGGFGVCIVQ